MKIIVQKYGGSSVATPDRIRAIAQKIHQKVKEGDKLVVVLSAMGDTTDTLIDLAHQVTTSPPAREMDMLLSTGEQASIALFSMALHDLGTSVVSLTGPQVRILAEPVHTKAKIIEIDKQRLLRELKANQVVVVAGFQGINVNGDIVTLGRGGSDTTAVALAAVLNAQVCEIYTDVDGVYTADPRIVPTARKLDRLCFDEMLELASSGAQVLQSRAVELGNKFGVEIIVRSSFNDSDGTLICKEDANMENVVVRGVAHSIDEAKVTVKGVPDRPGIAAKVFKPLAEANIVVDMIIQNVSESGVTDISFIVNRDDLEEVVRITQQTAEEIGSSEVKYDKNMGKVSVVGIGMRSHSGVAAKMFETLGEENINIQMISTSEIKLSCMIRENEVERAVQALHEKFELNKEQSQYVLQSSHSRSDGSGRDRDAEDIGAKKVPCPGVAPFSYTEFGV